VRRIKPLLIFRKS